LVRLDARSPDRLLAALRRGHPVVVARIADERVCLDLRTVADTDDGAMLLAVIGAALDTRGSA
jgi:hypothetical protein